MKRRDFLKSSAALAGAASIAAPSIVLAQAAPVINVGHLVGICMSPLFYAHSQGYFKEEGLDVQLKFMPNPGDALTALTSGAMNIIHNPFTNGFVAAANGAPIKIIAGSGAGGVVMVAQGSSGIKTVADLKAQAGKGLKIGIQRANTLELTFYRIAMNNGMKYEDFNVVFFSDVLSLAADFEAKAIDVGVHVEPFTTNMVDKQGGVALATNLDAWGPSGPDCVVKARADYVAAQGPVIKRYLKALLKADAAIKADMPKAVEILDAGKYYRVDKPTLAAALPRQKPQVDLTKGGDKSMEIAIKDLVALGYIKTAPDIVDLKLLAEVV